MLFSKKIEPRCTYCQKSAKLNEDQVLCIKKGIMPIGDHCHSFRYNPLKRIPPPPPIADFSRLQDEDFSL
ncbi:MAG: hypothetical protein RR053_02195 [Evtepia sp.]